MPKPMIVTQKAYDSSRPECQVSVMPVSGSNLKNALKIAVFDFIITRGLRGNWYIQSQLIVRVYCGDTWHCDMYADPMTGAKVRQRRYTDTFDVVTDRGTFLLVGVDRERAAAYAENYNAGRSPQTWRHIPGYGKEPDM